MPIRRFALALVLAVLASDAAFSQSAGQKPVPPPAPAPVKDQGKPAPPADKTPDYSQEPFVIETWRTLAHFENDGTGRREMRVRVRVQNEAGVQQLGQLVMGYNSANEKLDVNSVRVRKADGSVVTAGADAVQDLSAPIEREAPVYTDYRQKHITVPGLRPGEVLEYDLTTHIHTPLASGHFWLEYNFIEDAIVLDEQLTVSVPRNRALKKKSSEGHAPKVSENGDRTEYIWTSQHLKRADEDAEPRKKPRRRKPEAPDVQLTTFQSWEEVGRWYAGLESDRIAPNPALRAKVEELTRGLNTDLEKIAALYDFVAKNFRYVSLSFGAGRYQPHAAADVLANQYGDCKDKHTLLAALLEVAGLRAYPALIHSQRKLDESLPAPSQFDHVISVVPAVKAPADAASAPAAAAGPAPDGAKAEKEMIWLDTTTEVAPFRLLSARLRGKKALVVPHGASDDGPPRLMETPADPPFASTQKVEIEGTISELGKLDARVSYTLRGDNELPLRMAFRRTPQNQWKQLGQIVAAADGLRGEVSEVKAGDPAATREPYHLEYRVAVPNFLDWSSKKSQLGLPLPRIGMPPAEDDDDEDAEPLDLGSPWDVQMKLKLTLPERYATRAPVAVGVKRDYAEYRSSYKLEGPVFSAERTLRFLARELPADRVRDYRAFTRAVRADEEQTLSVETSSAAGKPEIPETAKAADLHEAAVSALRARNLTLAEELFRRVTELEPKHKWAWNNLGRVYLALRRPDDAVAAFQKQIEINPYDEYAYNNLGQALLQQQRFEEAIAAFRKQIEVNPLDKWAHANLGDLFRERRQYEEAASELEKAVAITPDNPGLYVSLGDAYLQLAQEEKALKAFDEALERAPYPPIWNNIAYQLSVKKVHLDRAQQYAESAVSATLAVLRNVDLDRLSMNEIGVVTSLAAYWDTLGWVHFQRGDLDKAERFVRAAWLLAQHGEVCDHLAQIEEKRGRKPQAIRRYAQALAATRPVKETRERLLALLPNEKQVEEMVRKAGSELSDARTVKLGKLLPERASAEFWLLFAPGTDGAHVESVKFISGSEKLRPFAGALRNAKFPVEFPDATQTKLLRRGILSCSSATGECLFVLMPADAVTSLN